MEEFVILDPTGKSWHIPYSEVPAALEAGGQFASMDEYNRITQYQQAQNNLQQQPQSIEDVARLITGTPREVMKQSLGMIAGNVFGDAGAKIGYGAIPFVEQIPQGVADAFSTASGALRGEERQPTPLTSDEYGAQQGRGFGELVGRELALAPLEVIGGALGGPVGGVAGRALMSGAITPGSAADRVVSAASDSIIPASFVAAGALAKKAPQLAEVYRTLTAKSDPVNALAQARKRHDVLDSQASQAFDYGRDQMAKRGINEIPVNPELINNIGRYLSKSEADKIILEGARKGNPDSLHKLQSLLGSRGFKSSASDDPAVFNKGYEMLGLRQELNQQTQDFLQRQGHLDLVQSYKIGQQLFKEMKDTYYANNKIAKIFDKETRFTPKKRKIPDYFSVDDVPTKRFLGKNPELEAEINLHLAKQELRDKKAAIKTLTQGATAGYGAYSIIDRLLGGQGSKHGDRSY